ncbi:hypothetical protein TNCV_55361 [Trichonephila clavipes]|nr:hypothetical protein TNCV_55361 [Trichonephila clavipes]
MTGYKRKTLTSRSGGPQRKRNKDPERQIYNRGVPSSANTPFRKKIRQDETSLQQRDIGPYNLRPRVKVNKEDGFRSSKGEMQDQGASPAQRKKIPRSQAMQLQAGV